MKLEAILNRRGHALRIATLHATFSALGGLVFIHLNKRGSGQPLLLDVAMGVLYLLVTGLVIHRLCQRREGELQRATTRLNHELHAQRRLTRQLQVAHEIFNATRDGILMTDPRGRIQVVNRAFCTISGYSEAEAVGKTPRILQSGFYDADFYRAMWATLAEKHYWEGELWNRRRDGSLYAERLSITAVLDEARQVQGYIGILSDISERKRAEERIHQLANFSSLNGLPNRSFMRSRGQEMLRLCADQGLPLAACHIDLDHFRTVNEALGHAGGDTLLKLISDRFGSVIRSRDALCHWGSDEFALLLPEADLAEATAIARRLLEVANRNYLIEERTVAPGASVGIALFPGHATDIDELLSRAASACQQAKAQGRNTIAVFESCATAHASQQLQLGSALRGAAARGEFELVYQPQLDLRRDVIIGFEALLRWHHPELGMVPPDRFIPIAESHGLMGEIGDWVLQCACRQGRAWLDQGMADVALAVNISAMQLRSGDLHDKVSAALQQHRLPARLLELELTESLLLDDVVDGLSQFDRLKRSLGVQLAVDDFGTGYSNLSSLGRFPADRLKIDRSFVAGMRSDERARSIVATIIQLGHNLGFRVIAEGVETAEDRALLAALGCDEIQGYLIGRPMPAQEVVAWWQARQPVIIQA